MEKKALRVLVVVSIVLFLVAIFSTTRNCRLRDRANFWKGHYDAQMEVSRDLAKENRVGKKAYESRIDELNGMVDSINTVNAELEMKLAVSDSKTEELAETEAILRDRVFDLDTAQMLVITLTASRDEWINKFNLSQQQLAEADKMNFALSEKYEASAGRINFLEGYIDELQDFIDVTKKNWNICEKRRKQTKTWGTIKTLAIGALGGYLVYQAVKK